MRVRRIQTGESFPVFDGKGQVAQAKLLSLSGKTGQVQLSNISTDTHRETTYAITLAQGLAGGDKMDWVIEKAVETGAQIIVPMQCERSILKLTRSSDQDRAQKRHAHWQGIVQAACEQCDRTVLTSIEPIQTFEAYLKSNPKPVLKLLLSPDTTKSMYSVLMESTPQDIVLMRQATKSFLWGSVYSELKPLEPLPLLSFTVSGILKCKIASNRGDYRVLDCFND